MYVVIKCKNKVTYDKLRGDLIIRGEDVFAFGEAMDPNDPFFEIPDKDSINDETEDIDERDETINYPQIYVDEPCTSQGHVQNQDCDCRPSIFAKDIEIKLEVTNEEEQKPKKISLSDDGVDALDLLGEDDEEHRTARYECVEAKISQKKGALLLQDGKWVEQCKFCSEAVSYNPKNEWCVKAHHVLNHATQITYECPYCCLPNVQRPVICRHLQIAHNQGFSPIVHPACKSVEDKKQLNASMSRCFPGTKLQSLDFLAEPDSYNPAVRSVMYYYVKFLKIVTKKPGSTTIRAVRLKCTQCKTCISRGPLEEKLKFEHALTHTTVNWIGCSKCDSEYPSKELFYLHNREIHQSRAQAICKEKEDLPFEEQQHVEQLVADLFPMEDDKEESKSLIMQFPSLNEPIIFDDGFNNTNKTTFERLKEMAMNQSFELSSNMLEVKEETKEEEQDEIKQERESYEAAMMLLAPKRRGRKRKLTLYDLDIEKYQCK